MTARFLGFGVGTLLATTLVFGGCGDDGGDDGATSMDTGMVDTGMMDTGATTDLSFATDIQPIIDANCVTDCHEPGGNWPTFDMSVPNLYDRLVGMTGPTQGIAGGCNLIEPGDSSTSYLYLKITDMHTGDPCQGTGVQMPAVVGDLTMSNPLPQGDIDTIMEWIDGGAPP